jgi:hypothetical protein
MNSWSNKNRVKDYNLPEHFEFGHQDCFATNYSIRNSNGKNQGGWITNNVFSAPLLQVLSLRSSWWTTIFFLFLCSHSTVWLNLLFAATILDSF